MMAHFIINDLAEQNLKTHLIFINSITFRLLSLLRHVINNMIRRLLIRFRLRIVRRLRFEYLDYSRC